MKKIILSILIFSSCVFIEDLNPKSNIIDNKPSYVTFDTIHKGVAISEVPFNNDSIVITGNFFNNTIQINEKFQIVSRYDIIEECNINSDKVFALMLLEKSANKYEYWCGTTLRIKNIDLKLKNITKNEKGH